MVHMRNLLVILISSGACLALVVERVRTRAYPEMRECARSGEPLEGGRATPAESRSRTDRLFRRTAGLSPGSMPPFFLLQRGARTEQTTPFAQPADTVRGIDRSNSILGRILEIDGYQRLKLDRMKGYRCLVANVNNREVRLLLDTGAPVTALDRKRTAHLGLEWQYAELNGDWSCYLPAMQVGPMRAVHFVVFHDDLGYFNEKLKKHGIPAIDGLLGADVLEQGEAIIDYRSNDLYVRVQN
jgi:hypothetical protein